MSTLRLRTRIARGVAVLGVLALINISASQITAGGQKPGIPVKLYFKYDLAQTKEEITARGANIVEIRPNTKQAVYLFLENTDKFGLKNLTVKLMKIGANGQPSVVLQTPMDLAGAISKESFKQIEFEPKEKAPKDLPKLAGPPFEMQVWVEQPSKNTKRITLPIRITEPSEYVNLVEDQSKYITATRTIAVSVKKKKQSIFGAPSIVLLDLDPMYMPKLKPIKTGGVYKQILLPDSGANDDSGVVKLEATNLVLDDAAPNDGRVYLTVDGVKRAFGFANSFTEEKMRPLGGMRMRLLAPRYFIPGVKMPVSIHVDNFRTSIVTPRTDPENERPVPPRIKLEWELNASGTALLPIAVLDGHRQQQVAFNPTGPNGAIVFDNVVRDWTVEVETSDLFGEKKLRATLLGQDGDVEEIVQETGEDEILVFVERSIRSPFAPLSYVERGDSAAATAVRAEIVLDSTPPALLFGADLEQKAAKDPRFVRGDLLRVKAVVVPQKPYSPISDVEFFVGKPTPKNTMPDDAVKAIEVVPLTKNWQDKPMESSEWLATFPIDTKKAGIHFISMQAKNQAGHVEYKTIKLVLVDAPEAGKNGKTAKVIGSVKVGNLLQAGASVFLTDEDGKVKGFAKSGEKPRGAFVIEKVKPGTYKVIATNPALKLRGETFVNVTEGATTVEAGAIEMKRE